MSDDILPRCRYSINEIQTIKKAIEELKKHEENMICYNRGFRTSFSVRRTQDIIDTFDNTILALDEMCQYDILK